MERVISVGGKELNIKATADSLFIYRAQFGRDGLTDIFALSDPSCPVRQAEDTFVRFLWAFAKAYNSDLAPLNKCGISRNEALISAPEVAETIRLFTRNTVDAKGALVKSESKSTTETILMRSIANGLTASDFKYMTLGMIIDYLNTCGNDREERKKEPKKRATQADIDAF